MKSGGDADIRQLDLATALSIAGQLRDKYARRGYLTTDDIGAEIKPRDQDYVAILAGAINDDGVIDGFEYVTLNGISSYYEPLLEAWRRQSPFFARLKVLDERARRKCGDDTTCGEEKQAARQAILQNSWANNVSLNPNIGEQNAAIETLLPWLKDPEVAQHFTPLFESATYFAMFRGVERRQAVKKLKAELEPFIFSADEDIQSRAVEAVGPQKVIPLAEQRLKKNPRDQQAFLVLAQCLAASHSSPTCAIRGV